MALQASYSRKTFQFNFDARTSRGPMADKQSWFIKVWDDKHPSLTGIGECGPLPGLSIDDRPDFEQVLQSVIANLASANEAQSRATPRWNGIVPAGFPSILFGVETALLDLFNGGEKIIFNNEFRGGKPIPINGLIWMGDDQFMVSQIDQKIAQGFTCIKLKVGGLDFERECSIIRGIRKRYNSRQITIRLDANGAFHPDVALERLNRLKEFDIHSVEQPIKQGQSQMADICRQSPIPVALDEELIGKETREEKNELLRTLNPSFIILKPTLHGGMSGCEEWIRLAQTMNIGWWITSALESNIGLNAICQFTSNYTISIPQGLGTGTIYKNNVPSPLTIKDSTIFLDASKGWETIS